MTNAEITIPEPPAGCNTSAAILDYLEFIEDEAFQEDAIHECLNEGVISYQRAYELRTGEKS